jgi:hypothetical protein
MPKDLPWLNDVAERDRLYSLCEAWIGTKRDPFRDLVGQQIVKHALSTAFPEREILGLPLAVET